MSDLEKLIRQNRITICRKCGGKMEHQQKGIYRCNLCGTEVLDDFGKVNKYLEENGPAPIVMIAKATGVSSEAINGFLKDGRIELPEDSSYYVHCEKCGCEIRYGRFCPQCTVALARGIKEQMDFSGLGEKPKARREVDNHAKMRFLKELNQK